MGWPHLRKGFKEILQGSLKLHTTEENLGKSEEKDPSVIAESER
jgi:hypothetical protein